MLYGSKFSWDNIFVNFGNALRIIKILASKTLCVLQLAVWIFQGSVEELPHCHQIEYFPVAASSI